MFLKRVNGKCQLMSLEYRTGKARTMWVLVAVILAGTLIALIMMQNNETKGADRYERLKGSWVRPDGGYVIEIKNVSTDGLLDCSYFNPNPIHVSQARATSEGDDIKLFIELQDTQYPGCTYNLTHEAKSDQLHGIYYQATSGQSYNILFNRVK